MSEQIFDLLGYGAEIRAYGATLGEWSRSGNDLMQLLETPLAELNEDHSSLLDLLKIAFVGGLEKLYLHHYTALVEEFTFTGYIAFEERMAEGSEFFTHWQNCIAYYKDLFEKEIDENGTLKVTPEQDAELADFHEYLNDNIYKVLPDFI